MKKCQHVQAYNPYRWPRHIELPQLDQPEIRDITQSCGRKATPRTVQNKQRTTFWRFPANAEPLKYLTTNFERQLMSDRLRKIRSVVFQYGARTLQEAFQYGLLAVGGGHLSQRDHNAHNECRGEVSPHPNHS